MSKVDRVNIFKQFRLDKITSILETRDGGSEVWLETAARGSRSFKVSLSIDEIEDILKAEDERRKKSQGVARVDDALRLYGEGVALTVITERTGVSYSGLMQAKKDRGIPNRPQRADGTNRSQE